MVSRRCKDCIAQGIKSRRKAPYPGPRCHTHNRIERDRRRAAGHGQHIMSTYNLSEEEYWELYEYQGGRCWICRKARGKGKRKLSVDHCHKTGEIRALLCQTCNRYILGWLEDDIEAFERIIEYLKSPPARGFFGGIRTVDGNLEAL